MNPRCTHRRHCSAGGRWAALVLALSAVLPGTVEGQSFPPALREVPAELAFTLHLELVLNQRATGRVVPVIEDNGEFRVSQRELHAIGVPLDSDTEGWVTVTRVAGMAVRYDAPRQRLYLDVPPNWLPHQALDGKERSRVVEALGSQGGLFNYDAYVSRTRGGHAMASLGHEARVFGETGVLRSTGAYRETLSGDGATADGYRRFDTSWRYSDPERMVTYEAGDVVTRPLGWTRAVRLGGVQFSRDFALRPDVITQPLLEVSGEAAVPTTLDLFIGGQLADSSSVDPGPFTLTAVPGITGAGEATVITTDALGRQVATTLPFYATPTLLRPGLSSFSFSAGALRRHFGRRNFDYGGAAGSGSYRLGVTNRFTLELHVEAAESLGVAGVGGGFGLWQLGSLEASLLQSRHGGRDGHAYSASYRYTSAPFNVGLRHSVSDEDFVDLAVLELDGPGRRRETLQATAGVRLGRMGSVSGGYFDLRSGDDDRTRLLNLSYHRPLWGRANLFLTANREIGGDWSTRAQVSVPLGRNRGTVSAGVQRDSEGDHSLRMNHGRSAPLDGGPGWNLGYQYREARSDFRTAALTWRAPAARLRGGAYGTGGDDTIWADLRGSLVWMDGQAFAAEEIRNGFVVVATAGVSGIPVRYENQRVGVTRSSGHLLVPWATSYYAGKYEIDPLGLPADVSVPVVEQRVAVKAGSGYLLRFPVEPIVAASIRLQDADEAPLPLGSEAATATGLHSVVGWDGLAYFEGLDAENMLTVTLPDGQRCRVQFRLDPEARGIQQLGPLTCQ